MLWKVKQLQTEMSKVISPHSHHKKVRPSSRPATPTGVGPWMLVLSLSVQRYYSWPPFSSVSLWERLCCFSTWAFLLHRSWLQLKLYVADQFLICCCYFEFLDLNRLWTGSYFMGIGQWCNCCYFKKKKSETSRGYNRQPVFSGLHNS